MNDDMDIIRGSGNVFRDLGHPDADREQLRALLAAKIIGALDERKLTVRAAHEATSVAAVDFSRIRNANPGRLLASAYCPTPDTVARRLRTVTVGWFGIRRLCQ
jgi:hypothetical protein